ncbi:MAG: hypothetical protein P4M12_10385 [Gammaproteobacteria bacterium]|nr:hypothetical protein [Gammaproteobacteria bacterium]
MQNRQWSGVISRGDVDFKAYKKQINAIINQASSSAGLVTRKLPYQAFKVRINQTHRLLFVSAKIDNANHLLLLELIENHDHQKSKYMNDPQLLKPYLNEEFIKDEILKGNLVNVTENDLADDPTQIDHDLTPNIAIEPFCYYNGNFINLNLPQIQAINAELPLNLTGAAGSGKSLVAVSILLQLAQNIPAEEQKKILFVTKSAKLLTHSKQQFQMQWEINQANAVTEAPVIFMTYHDFIAEHAPGKNVVDNNHFEEWYENRKNTYKEKGLKFFENLGCNKIYQELKVCSDVATLQEYMLKGKKNSSLKNDEEKKLMFSLFEEYKAFLLKNDIANIDFYEVNSDKEYYAVISDETQDLSPLGVRNLYNVSNEVRDIKHQAKRQIVLLSDTRQDVESYTSIMPTLRALVKNHIELEKSYRCGTNIIKLANKIMQTKKDIVGSDSDKPIDDSATHAGKVLWVDPNKLETIQEIKNSYKETEIVIITSLELIEKAKIVFNTLLVFTAEQFKGLESKFVIIYKPFKEEIFLNANKVMSDSSSSSSTTLNGQARSQYRPAFNRLYTAATRAIETLIICQAKKHKVANLYNSLQLETQIANQNSAELKPAQTTTQADWLALINSLIESEDKDNLKTAEEVYNKNIHSNLSYSQYLENRKPKPIQSSASSSSSVTALKSTVTLNDAEQNEERKSDDSTKNLSSSSNQNKPKKKKKKPASVLNATQETPNKIDEDSIDSPYAMAQSSRKIIDEFCIDYQSCAANSIDPKNIGKDIEKFINLMLDDKNAERTFDILFKIKVDGLTLFENFFAQDMAALIAKPLTNHNYLISNRKLFNDNEELISNMITSQNELIHSHYLSIFNQLCEDETCIKFLLKLVLFCPKAIKNITRAHLYDDEGTLKNIITYHTAPIHAAPILKTIYNQNSEIFKNLSLEEMQCFASNDTEINSLAMLSKTSIGKTLLDEFMTTSSESYHIVFYGDSNASRMMITLSMPNVYKMMKESISSLHGYIENFIAMPAETMWDIILNGTPEIIFDFLVNTIQKDRSPNLFVKFIKEGRNIERLIPYFKTKEFKELIEKKDNAEAIAKLLAIEVPLNIHNEKVNASLFYYLANCYELNLSGLFNPAVIKFLSLKAVTSYFSYKWAKDKPKYSFFNILLKTESGRNLLKQLFEENKIHRDSITYESVFEIRIDSNDETSVFECLLKFECFNFFTYWILNADPDFMTKVNSAINDDFSKFLPLVKFSFKNPLRLDFQRVLESFRKNCLQLRGVYSIDELDNNNFSSKELDDSISWMIENFQDDELLQPFITINLTEFLSNKIKHEKNKITVLEYLCSNSKFHRFLNALFSTRISGDENSNFYELIIKSISAFTNKDSTNTSHQFLLNYYNKLPTYLKNSLWKQISSDLVISLPFLLKSRYGCELLNKINDPFNKLVKGMTSDDIHKHLLSKTDNDEPLIISLCNDSNRFLGLEFINKLINDNIFDIQKELYDITQKYHNEHREELTVDDTRMKIMTSIKCLYNFCISKSTLASSHSYFFRQPLGQGISEVPKTPSHNVQKP